MALHQWGGGGTRTSKVSCTINPDGSVELSRPPRTSARAPERSWRSSPPRSWASSRPTSSRTSATRLSRRARPRAVRPPRPSMAPPCFDAATKARDAHVQEDRPGRQGRRRGPGLKNGQLCVEGEPIMGWKEACRKLGMASISETGSAAEGSPASESAAASSPRSPSTSRPAWSRSRRSSPSRIRA